MSKMFFRVFHEKLEHEINSNLECKNKMKKSEESLKEMTLQNHVSHFFCMNVFINKFNKIY